MRNSVRVAIAGVVVCVALAGPVRARQGELDTSLPALLKRLGLYVDKYERDLSAVVSEEYYVQTVASQGGLPPDPRELRSEFLLAKAGELGWVAFRDVFEVDNTPVTGRSDRLVELFIKPPGDARDQLRRIVEASSKYNLGWVNRNINVPTMVLQFARPDQQARAEFSRSGTTQVGDIKAREIRFKERGLPRVVQTPDNAAATGAFWIEEATGRVVRTEMRVSSGATTAVIRVGYAYQPKLDIWLPELMTETYSTPRQPTITGRAIYEKFRRFDVEVDMIIK